MKRVLGSCILVCFISAAGIAQEHKISVQKFEQPKYPPIARQARIMGLVNIELEVHADGSVGTVRVVKGHPIFTDAVLKSLKGWRFACNGCKFGERFVHTMAVSFELSDEVDSSDTRFNYEFPDVVHVITGIPTIETST